MSRSSRPAQDTTRPTSDMDTSQSSSTSIASTAYSSAAARDGPAAEETVFIDGRPSAGGSPIDTTSPRPPSSGTTAISPALSGRDDSLKHQGSGTSDRLSRESSAVSGHSQVERSIPVRREPDALEWYEEDAYSSPAMPSDCTNLRVRDTAAVMPLLLSRVSFGNANAGYRKFPSHRHRSSAPEADSAAHSNPRDKSTKSRSRSSTSTCASLFSVATCVSKVCHPRLCTS